MNQYEKLLQDAAKQKIAVIDNYDLSSTRLKGLYCDNTIAIRKDIETQAEKSCILAEELGHYHTSSGNILDQTQTMNRKQEYRARLYGYNLKIGLTGIISAYEAGCRNLDEIAEHLDVTEEYLKDALRCYRSKYGTYTCVDNYMIQFEPNLAVMKITGHSAFIK